MRATTGSGAPAHPAGRPSDQVGAGGVSEIDLLEIESPVGEAGLFDKRGSS